MKRTSYNAFWGGIIHSCHSWWSRIQIHFTLYCFISWLVHLKLFSLELLDSQGTPELTNSWDVLENSISRLRHRLCRIVKIEIICYSKTIWHPKCQKFFLDILDFFVTRMKKYQKINQSKKTTYKNPESN